MSAGGDNRRSDRRGRLTPLDEALWSHVTRDVRPTGGKPRVPTGVNVEPAEPAQVQVQSSPRSPSRASLPEPTRSPSPPPRRPEPPPSSPSRRAAPEATRKPGSAAAKPPAPEVRPIVLERRKSRRIARNADELEARLDLHGMTQDEAHRSLELFLRRAHNDGLGTVIIITGKGGPASGREETGEGYARRERGVLRRMVPLWLDGPALRGIVIGYSAAHVRHGGAGALYVLLRRSGR